MQYGVAPFGLSAAAQSRSVWQGTPQTGEHVGHCVMQLYPQSQLELDEQRAAYDVHVVLLAPPAPPEPVLDEAGVNAQPFASRHVDSVTPEHVPSGVPTQFGAQ